MPIESCRARPGNTPFVLTRSDISYYFGDTKTASHWPNPGGMMSGKHHDPREARSSAADGGPRPEAADAVKDAPDCEGQEARASSLEAEIAALREELSATNDKYL